MKAIEGRLNRLEEKAGAMDGARNYCKCPPPPPIVTRDDAELGELGELCHRCGKPSPPNRPRIILVFK